MRKTYLGFLWLFVSLFGLPKTTHSWNVPTHKDQLTRMAIDLLKQFDSVRYGPEIWDEAKGHWMYIMQGAWDEDFPCDPYYGIRANNHYRHALTGIGLTNSALGLGDPDVDALSWAKANPLFDKVEEFNEGGDWEGYKKWKWDDSDIDYGNMSWERAINRYDYTESSKKLAYYTLGFVLHLLQDMGEPEHVHDDPHGDSGYHGLELWVQEHWNQLKPDVRTLRPRRFVDPSREKIVETIDDYFDNLARISYSVSRFHGGDLRVTPPYIDPRTNLARMFHPGFRQYRLKTYKESQPYIDEEEWYLANRNKVQIIQGADTAGNEYFSFNARQMIVIPHMVKGAFSGDWWSTHMEIPPAILKGRKNLENDVPGFYYLELSDETPTHGQMRQLYPDAFLPTPLEAVEDQCRGWDIENVKARYKTEDERHLYSITARTILPYVVRHTAGLMQLFYDIVNHPPYVKSVEVRQGTELRYSRTWKDKEETSGRGMMKWYRTTKTLVGRSLENDPDHPDKDLEPGTIVIKIDFSEPVSQDDVRVMLGDRLIKGFLQDNREVWIGQFQIPVDGSFKGEKDISIRAKDENYHYNDEGGVLDKNPGKPARRVYSSGMLEWKDYTPGEDTNHSVVIKVEMPITTGADKNAYWLVADGSLFDLYWGTLASTENKYGKDGILAGPFPDTKTRREVFDYIAGQITDKRIINKGQYDEKIVGKFQGTELQINRFFRIENGEIRKR